MSLMKTLRGNAQPAGDPREDSSLAKRRESIRELVGEETLGGGGADLDELAGGDLNSRIEKEDDRAPIGDPGTDDGGEGDLEPVDDRIRQAEARLIEERALRVAAERAVAANAPRPRDPFEDLDLSAPDDVVAHLAAGDVKAFTAGFGKVLVDRVRPLIEGAINGTPAAAVQLMARINQENQEIFQQWQKEAPDLMGENLQRSGPFLKHAATEVSAKYGNSLSRLEMAPLIAARARELMRGATGASAAAPARAQRRVTGQGASPAGARGSSVARPKGTTQRGQMEAMLAGDRSFQRRVKDVAGG